MDKIIQDMVNHTNLNPWYWIAYGEKCYAFAVVEAITENEGDELPRPGSQLQLHEVNPKLWVGENGVNMLIELEISNIESQNGDTICSFIAEAHAMLLSEHLPKIG